MILNSGIVNDLSNEDKKRVKILNVIALLGAINCLIFILLDLFQGNISTAAGTIGGLVFIIVTFLFQRKHFYVTARAMLTIAGFLYFFVNANWLFTGKLSEFFYIMIVMLTMIFFDKLWIHLTSLSVCLLAFYIPNFYLELYDKEVFGYANMGFLFVSTFLILRHFKKLNAENEEKLYAVNEVLAEKQGELKKLNQELKEINRLKSDFLIHFSHELKTPLTIINSATHKLPDDNKDLGNIKNALEQQSKNILELSDDLLSLAKVQSENFELNFKDINLEETLNQTYYQFLEEFDQKNIVLNLNYQLPAKLTINTEKIGLIRIINNLLSNALKYSKPNSITTLQAEKNGNSVIISVEDQGVGIPESQLKSIFKQFYRVENTGEIPGTGVGLAFVKAMTEKLNGQIKVKSKVGRGSKFSLTFQHEYKEESLIIEKSETRSLKDANILIVEDNQEIQDYLGKVLNDYHSVYAYNGLQAIEQLKSNLFDVIITDYMMPQMDGVSLIEWIKENQIATPIIVLTAIKESKIDFLRLGVDEIMPKPFNPEELLVRVNRLIKSNSVKEAFKHSNTQNEFEQKLKKLINDKIGVEEIKITDLAEELNMSIRTFQRKVKELTGLTPKALIKEEKLQKIQFLVENGLVSSLKELNGKVGFTNTTYLQSIYEQRFGKKISFKTKV